MNLSSRIVTLSVVLSVLGLRAAPSSAQDTTPFLEVHGGAAFPVGDFRSGSGPGEGTSAGPSLQVVFAVPSGGWRAYYMGFSQHRFACEAAGCDAEGRYVATGFNVGIRIVPLQGTLTPWIGVGGITTRVETGDLAATTRGMPDAGVSDLGFGGEAGLGLMVRLGESLAWSASGLVSAVGSKLPGGETLALRYLTAHTGITFVF